MGMCITGIITPDNMQIAQVAANVALVGILALNLWNARIQSKGLQLSLFSHIAEGLRSVAAAPTSTDTKEEINGIAARMAWEYESFAFFANHRYLNQNIVDHFTPLVISDCHHMQKEYPVVFTLQGPETFKELRALYEKETGKQLPHANIPRQK